VETVIKSLEQLNRIYVFKRKTLMSLCAGASVVLLVIGVWTLTGVAKNRASKNEYRGLLARLNVLVDYGKKVPTMDNLRELQKDTVVLRSHYEELEKALGKKKGRAATAMEFKGDLLRAQRVVLAKARERGVTIPDHIGVEEFIGKKIPDESEVSKLAGGIPAIKTLLDILMDGGVTTIGNVARLGVTQVKADPKDTGYFYNDHKIELRFESSQDMLIKVINSIITSKEFYVIRGVEVKCIAESKYAVRMVVSGIEFL
jgi:hypothetical protein